ncbi:long-chain fatty acid transporter [Phenylobacterium deserti]|uniref:Long-chain fatty acid transporter n=2 Tax=Phenylobacterium deserti TaxID=1914756 RepID=A0A328A8F3_9CAUL|nr:long-chain fatty acid transporter [Phenylobacterium deserti]
MLGGAAVALAQPALANGFAVPVISVEGAGRANAGEAARMGVGALWSNPAAIARESGGVSLGAHYQSLSTEFTDQGSTVVRPIPPSGLTTPVGGRSRVSDAAGDYVGFFGAAATRINDRFAVGLSVTRPFHIETDFGSDAWTRYDTISNKIDAIDVQVTGAVQVNPWLDVGVGVSAQRVDAFLDSAYPNLDPSAPDGHSHLNAKDWAYGWTVGAQSHVNEVTFGVSYRSAIEHEMDGDLRVSGLLGPLESANFQAPSVTSFTLPWNLTAAARWQATPQLTLSTQLVRTGWSKYDAIHVAFAGQVAEIEQNFRDTTSISFGADYTLDDVWTVRAGVGFEPTPTRNTLRESGVFDADRRVVAVGASGVLTSVLTVHGALTYTDFASAPIVDLNGFYQGTPASTVSPAFGEFDGHGLAASVGMDWRF